MFPAIIPAQLVREFQFWSNGAVRRGMRYGMEFYRYASSFSSIESQQAYCLGTALCEQHQQVVITKSKDGYTVWLLLRSIERSSEPLPGALGHVEVENLVPT